MIAGVSLAQLEAMTPLARQVFENEWARFSGKFRRTQPKRTPKAHCQRGHLLVGDNLRVYHYANETVRVCVRCLELRRELKKVKQSEAEREARRLFRKYGIRDKGLLASARVKAKAVAA